MSSAPHRRDVSEAAWWIVERGLPALLVMSAVPVLALAALLQVLGARDEGWVLFLLGVALWAGGIGWGVLVNRVGPSLAS